MIPNIPAISDMDWSIYSDCHKDAYGFRPRGNWPQTKVEFDLEMASMQVMITQQIDEKRAEEAKAWTEFKATVRNLAKTNKVSQYTAIRWLVNGSDYGSEELCYDTGIGFSKAYWLDKALAVEKAR